MLDENNLSYGGAVAAPVFSEITHFALQQYGVNPSDPTNKQYAAAQATAHTSGTSCAVPHGADLVRAEAAAQAALAAQQQRRGEHRGAGHCPARRVDGHGGRVDRR